MSTKLIPLVCNHCGAPLSVPEGVRFVTCGHCQTSLSIEHEGDAYFTKQLEELANTAERLDTQVTGLEKQVQRQQLDMDWETTRKKYFVKTKDGQPREPKPLSSASTVFQLIFGIGFLGVFFAVSTQAPGGFGVIIGGFVLVALVVLVVGTLNEHSKATAYRAAKRRYQQRRAELSD